LDDDWSTVESLLWDNAKTLELAKQHGVSDTLIDDAYEIDTDF